MMKWKLVESDTPKIQFNYSERVLIQLEDGWVGIGQLFKPHPLGDYEQWFFDDESAVDMKVVAWQELPAPMPMEARHDQ